MTAGGTTGQTQQPTAMTAGGTTGQTQHGRGQSNAVLRYTRPWPTVDGFDKIYIEAGLVLLNVNSSTDLVKDGRGLSDKYLRPPTKHQPHGLKQLEMSDEDDAPINPDNLTTQISPLRKRYIWHNTLAPANGFVQGPHQEGASHTRGNRRVCVFLCEEPSEKGGGTAFFDMARAWELLPGTLQQALRKSYFVQKTYLGIPVKVPAVVKHEITGRPCLQFYCFGRVARDCVDVYRHKTKRYYVRPDVYSYEIDQEADLVLEDESGRKRPFIGIEFYRLLEAIYSSMVTYYWRKGDVLWVDNVRWAHARMEGSGPNRKVHFLIYGPVQNTLDLTRFERP